MPSKNKTLDCPRNLKHPIHRAVFEAVPQPGIWMLGVIRLAHSFDVLVEQFMDRLTQVDFRRIPFIGAVSRGQNDPGS
jgi:hypothetical protein